MLNVENRFEQRQITFAEIGEGDVFMLDLDAPMLKLPRVCLADDMNDREPMVPTYNAYAFETGDFYNVSDFTVVYRPNKAVLNID